MANWHGYLLITVPPGFTATNRRAAYDAVSKLGVHKWDSEEVHDITPIVYEYDEEGNIISETGGEPFTWTRYFHRGSPAKFNHQRESLNGSQIISELEIDEDEITRDAIVDLVASATGLPRPPIDATMKYEIFAEGEGWMDSGDACRAFLAANRDDWEEEA